MSIRSILVPKSTCWILVSSDCLGCFVFHAIYVQQTDVSNVYMFVWMNAIKVYGDVNAKNKESRIYLFM